MYSWQDLDKAVSDASRMGYDLSHILSENLRVVKEHYTASIWHTSKSCTRFSEGGLYSTKYNHMDLSETKTFSIGWFLNKTYHRCSNCILKEVTKRLDPYISTMKYAGEAHEILSKGYSLKEDLPHHPEHHPWLGPHDLSHADFFDLYGKSMDAHHRLLQATERTTNGTAKPAEEALPEIVAFLSEHAHLALTEAERRSRFLSLERRFSKAPCPPVYIPPLLSSLSRTLDAAFEAYCSAGFSGRDAHAAAWMKFSLATPLYCWSSLKPEPDSTEYPEVLELRTALLKVLSCWDSHLSVETSSPSHQTLVCRSKPRSRTYPPYEGVSRAAVAEMYLKDTVILALPSSVAYAVCEKDDTFSNLGVVPAEKAPAVCELAEALLFGDLAVSDPSGAFLAASALVL